MKILFIDREISMVGSCVVTLNCARELVNLGHDVKFAGMFRVKGYPDPGRTSLITPPDSLVKILRKNKFLLTFLGPVAFFFSLKKHAFWADIIVGSSYPTHWMAAALGIIAGKPVFWNCFEPWIKVSFNEIPKVGFSAWLASFVARSPVDKIFIRKIKGIYTLDNKNRKRVKKIYRRNARIIYPGVDYEFFSKGDKRKAYRRWRFLKDKFIITCVGSFTPMKNQETLLRAFTKVKDKAKDAVVCFAGDGPMRNYLKDLTRDLKIEKKVYFLGQVEPKNLRHLFAASAIVAFPAVNQTWGLTPFEAACVATPSVVSNDCGAAELILQEKIGMVTKPDEQSFANAILEYYNNPRKIRTIGARAGVFVKERHTWQIYAKKVEKFFQRN